MHIPPIVTTSWVPALLALSAAACGAAGPAHPGREDEISEATDAIASVTSSQASQFQVDRAVKTPACTATRIHPRFALTAAHCVGEGWATEAGSEVEFYDEADGSGPRTAEIDEIFWRTGVDPTACFTNQDACWDFTGKYAEIALLRLSADVEAELGGPHATLAWAYPGEGTPGDLVGAGLHNALPNPWHELRQTSDETAVASDADGRFETTEGQTDSGDSGGPFYVGGRVLGVLAGEGEAGLDTYDLFTSVPRHLTWILTTIGYTWRGQPPQANTVYVGTLLQSFVGSELACQYACESTTSCQAYNFNDAVDSCGLYTSVGQASTQSGWRGALKHGARSGTSGDAVGHLRSDGKSAVVHAATNGRVHELLLDGGWDATDIHATAPTVASRLTAYRRDDGADAVVFRASTGHLIELARTGSVWQSFDLTAVTSAELATGNPIAYVRADGVSAIVYRGATTGHMVELRLGSRGWVATDLSTASGSNVVATSDPSAFVRSDGRSSVVFRAGSQVWELHQAVGQSWDWGVPSQLATGAPAAASRPFGYTHKNGTNAVVYRTSDGKIIELYVIGTQWFWGQIGSGAMLDPVAYVRTDGVEAVLFRNSSGQIVELTNTPWQSWNLTTVTGAAAPAGTPSVYHRGDGYNAVLFESAPAPFQSAHVHELYYRRGSQWGTGDLTNASGETP